MKVRLQPYPRKVDARPVTVARPYYLGERSTFVHRVRYINQWPTHLGIWFVCGNVGHCGSVEDLLDKPPPGRLVCSRCEALARIKKLPPNTPRARVGRLVPVRVDL